MTDRTLAAIRFGLDFYMESPADHERLHRQAYFKGLYGFQHDGKTPKGFVELHL